jgi:predicted RNA-binding Zn ribbon-like protein
LAWGHHAGILTAEEALRLARVARGKAAAARRTLAQATSLRETLHTIFEATAHHRPVPAAAVIQFNRFVAGAAKAARLEPAGDVNWHWTSNSERLDHPIWSITRSAAELLTAGRLDRVKVCPGQACGWIFLDQSRNGRRRWCEMQVCGSRAKMRRYRKRKERNLVK